MSDTPEEYNMARIASGTITPQDITRLVTLAQEKLGVRPDGWCGPVTLEALRPSPVSALVVDATTHRLRQVLNYDLHPTWYGANTPITPLGVVWHTSATAPGTARNMARRRQRQFGLDKNDRLSSWHLSIEANGEVHQMVPFNRAAWHAGSNTAKKLPFGWANYCTIGIELISESDRDFPPAQVRSACEVAQALRIAYSIPRDRLSLFHADIDPARRSDPGKEWMEIHAKTVEAFAFA